jgi:hypothetical protein
MLQTWAGSSMASSVPVLASNARPTPMPIPVGPTNVAAPVAGSMRTRLPPVAPTPMMP